MHRKRMKICTKHGRVDMKFKPMIIIMKVIIGILTMLLIMGLIIVREVMMITMKMKMIMRRISNYDNRYYEDNDSNGNDIVNELSDTNY